MSFFSNIFSKPKKEKLDEALEASNKSFFARLGKAIVGKSTVDDEVLDALEEILVGADVSIATTIKIIERVEQRVAKDKYLGTSELDRLIREEVAALLHENDHQTYEVPQQTKPYVLLVVGVNGVGKTTTIGKLAAQFKKHGHQVMLGAADTFRAAAVDQLQQWGKRIDVPVVSKGMNTDPSAVAYEAVERGKKEAADVVIVDTAGRLHTKVNLMQELSKIKRVIQKVIPDAPHDVLLVLDGSTGQNAIQQARAFIEATEVTCLAITKLDGTARGGVVIGIVDEFNIPVRYVGVGEQIEDLQLFDKDTFVNSLFGNQSISQ